MRTLTWLHLSDWHQRGTDFDRDVVRDALMKDIKARAEISTDLAKIDFIVLSGDVVWSGSAEEYRATIDYLLDPVLDAAGLSARKRDRLFIVPGNHDLDRECFDILPSDLLKKLDSPKTVNDWLTTDRRREALLSPFSEYAKFITNYMGSDHDPGFDPAYGFVRSFEAEEKTVSVLGLNSAWLSGRRIVGAEIDDYGALVLGEHQFHELMNRTRESDIRIAVMHHPFPWLTEFDRNRVAGELTRCCHFLLQGHQHQAKMEVISGTAGNAVLISAGACYLRRDTDTRYPNAYNFVHLDFEGGTGCIYLRRYSEPRNKWLEDVDTADNGVHPFDLPRNLVAPIPSTRPTPALSVDDKEIRRYCQKAESLHANLPVAGFVTRLKIPIDIEESTFTLGPWST